VDWEPAARVFVENARVAHLATVDEAGRPHLVPICFALMDDMLYSVVDDKPKTSPDLQRLRNIEAHAEVAVLCDTYEEDWRHLGWVMLRGYASVLTSGEEHAAALVSLRDKYPQYRTHALEGRPLIRVTPFEAHTWGAVTAPMGAEDEAAGLNLVRTVQRVPAAHITTEFRAGLATGFLARLHYAPEGARRVLVESEDEAPMPDEGGRMLRYSLDALEDGLYAADSVGPAGSSRTTYFEVAGGAVRRIFDSERRALQELRRRER
jgi:PPOX class probable F420-dependent enzyme